MVCEVECRCTKKTKDHVIPKRWHRVLFRLAGVRIVK